MTSPAGFLRRLRPILAVGVLMALAGVAGWLIGAAGQGGAVARPLPDLGPAPAYSNLTNQLGTPVSSSRFDGKVRIVTFLFPYCTTYCPLIAAHLVGLERMLDRAGIADRVVLVTFNVDPAGTGPKAMRAFLKQYGWDPTDPHWQFLTGTPAEIRRVVTDGFHVYYRKVPEGTEEAPEGAALSPQPEVENPLAARAHVDYDISHNDSLVVVDAAGRMRKIYTQGDVVSNLDLLDTIGRILPEAFAGHPAGTGGQ